MKRHLNIVIRIVGDFLALLAGWHFFYYLRFQLGWFQTQHIVEPISLFLPGVVVSLFWLLIFAVFGMYRELHMISRFDDVLRVGKITIIGTLILFFVLFLDDLNWNASNIGNAKYYTITYWAVTFLFVSFSHLFIATVQKYQAQRGKGLHNTVIVGTGPIAKMVYEDIKRNQFSGMNVLGFMSMNGASPKLELPEQLLGSLKELKQFVKSHDVRDVIVALEQDENQDLLKVLDELDMPNVSVKILPDFYQMIIGLNRTNQIFGLPFVDVMPNPMPTWERIAKRGLDIVLSLIILLLSLPLTLLIALIIKMTSKGPIVYRQERVGRFGKPFVMLKFRSMFIDAERDGPQLAKENDPRITPVGLWLRKLRLDEIPQFINVLKGEMSLVGPRPERPVFVDEFKKIIPLYTRRLRVKPGITGWAQVKWKYDESLDDVKEKTKYDLFYVENVSLRMDFKILINTVATVLLGKGR